MSSFFRSKVSSSLLYRIRVCPTLYRIRVSASSTQSSKFAEYDMPTVTWGVIQGRKEQLVSRVIICDYLKTLGIVPDELEHLELPSTIPVMAERVEFLQRLGLTVDDINCYPLMLGCSVRKNMIPVLGYLEKIGIERSKLGEFVKSYPQVLHSSVIVDLAPVLKFLRGLDVERHDLGYVLQKYPQLLGFKLEGTMSTSVAYLISIGVGSREIGPMVTQFPYLLGMRVGTVIKPLVEYLVNLGLPRMIVARMLEKRSYLLGFDLEQTVKKNVDCLVKYGVRKELIPSVIAQYPPILGLPLEAKMSTQQYFFTLKLKMEPGGFGRVVERMPQVVSLGHKVIEKAVRFLLERGFKAAEVAEMVEKCPQLLAMRVELMKNSLLFFKNEMGERGAKELVDFPHFFTHSLESRVKQRQAVLKRKGVVGCSLAWMLNCSDKRFEERFFSDYVEEMGVAGSYSGPSFAAGGKLELPPSGHHLRPRDGDESEGEEETLHRRTISF